MLYFGWRMAQTGMHGDAYLSRPCNYFVIQSTAFYNDIHGWRWWGVSNSCTGMHGDAWSPCMPIWAMQLFCHPKYSILYGALMIFMVGGGGEWVVLFIQFVHALTVARRWMTCASVWPSSSVTGYFAPPKMLCPHTKLYAGTNYPMIYCTPPGDLVLPIDSSYNLIIALHNILGYAPTLIYL